MKYLVKAVFLFLLTASPVIAEAASFPAPALATAVQSQNWAEAYQLAARSPHPVLAQKLVTYLKLLQSPAPGSRELADFLDENPTWPSRQDMKQELVNNFENLPLSTEATAREVADICDRVNFYGFPQGNFYCAEAYQTLHQNAQAFAYARQAWVAGITESADIQVILDNWANSFSFADNWQRFETLSWNGHLSEAAGMIPFLSPKDQAFARVRMAFLNKSPTAYLQFAALGPASVNDPTLVLEALYHLRTEGHYQEGLTLWKQEGFYAETRAAFPQQNAFWREREYLSRDLLAEHLPKQAFYLISVRSPDLTLSEIGAQDFFAGFIALNFLKEPKLAARYFSDLQSMAGAIISKARADYWLGEAEAQYGDVSGWETNLEKAEMYPVTFYGQVAALTLNPSVKELNRRILAMPSPTVPEYLIDKVQKDPLALAARMLVQMQDPIDADNFLMQMIWNNGGSPLFQAAVAKYATSLQLYYPAVMASRYTGFYGIALPDIGWPVPFTPPPSALPAPIVLGIIRQESSFDPRAVSGVGALGLMQLMPQTAAQESGNLGMNFSLQDLLNKPQYNMTVGANYLANLVQSFNGILPYAIAAYNAGPGNVNTWLMQNGNPFWDHKSMINWIELIPFNQTRNYVERVIENIAVYRAKEGIVAPYPVDLTP